MSRSLVRADPEGQAPPQQVCSRPWGWSVPEQWPLFAVGPPFRRPGSSPGANPSCLFHHSELSSATSAGAFILSQKPHSFGRSHVFHSGPIWQLWPLAWPHRRSLFPFTGSEVFLPEKSTSFTRLFLMVSLFLALSVMPIPCTLDERIQGQRTWINGVFLFLNTSKQHKSVQWVQTPNYFHACCSLSQH